MITAYILTMVILYGDNPANIFVQYDSQETCEAAKKTNREALVKGQIILSTCTKK